MDNNQTLNLSEQEQIRRQKLAALQEAGCDPFQITKYHVTHHSADVKASYDALEGQAVSVAGRMMAKRIMGKASFCQVQDLTGILQIYGRPRLHRRGALRRLQEDGYRRHCRCRRYGFQDQDR